MPENPIVREVLTASDLRRFIYLPEILHKDHMNWVPPLYGDEFAYFNRNKNLAFSYCDTIMLMASLEGKPAGRIMGIINKRHNEVKHETTARFSFFECIDKKAVAELLLGSIERWALEKGMTGIIGPFGMYYHDPIGFLTEGFNEIPSTTANYNLDYIPRLIESAHYEPAENLVVYKLPVSEKLSEIYYQVREKILSRNKLRIIPFKSRKDFRAYIKPVLGVMNESFTEIYGYSQLDEREMEALAAHFIPLLDPRLVAVVEADDGVAGFMITMPNVNKGIIAAGGKLFPFGLFKIISAARKAEQLDLLIGGIKEKYRGKGIDVLISIHIMEQAWKMGFKTIDSHLELESNWKIRAEMEKLGGRISKRYRIYRKKLC